MFNPKLKPQEKQRYEQVVPNLGPLSPARPGGVVRPRNMGGPTRSPRSTTPTNELHPAILVWAKLVGIALWCVSNFLTTLFMQYHIPAFNRSGISWEALVSGVAIGLCFTAVQLVLFKSRDRRLQAVAIPLTGGSVYIDLETLMRLWEVAALPLTVVSLLMWAGAFAVELLPELFWSL